MVPRGRACRGGSAEREEGGTARQTGGDRCGDRLAAIDSETVRLDGFAFAVERLTVWSAESVADPLDAFDGEPLVTGAGADLADTGNRPLYRIVAYDPPVPALFEKVIATEDTSFCPGERDKDLHDPWLDGFFAPRRPDEASGRVDHDTGESHRCDVGKVNRL
ncbi:hypothetical protein N0B51_04980 [Tsuneonella sp. YG55]|uniref:Uncharacterized protein n=1 Tax=Tsuneonella litorea TaxID=2976475 RepID=A0A9X2W0F8_9SPHN|nr:hypothetical protein [Tsuneonella litorea]MCT2558328.1 hypothetical protein [Tsuneonella litorea]